MALSQDFEARRRQRLQEQHRKRKKMRKIRRLIFLLALILVLVVIIVNIVQCAKKPSNNNTNTTTTQLPQKTEKPEEARFMDSVPEPEEGENDYLTVIKNSGQTKHVYLTFDKGPSKEVTPAILDVLRKYNVKATFFMTGNDIKEYPYLCTRAMEEGHLVLPLSKSDNADILYADKTTFIDEVEETYELITENSPSSVKPIKLYRFLNGSNYSAVKNEYKDELAQNGYYYCDWNTGIGDSNTTKTSQQLLSYFTSNKPQINNLIIQMNKTDKNTATAEMLGDMIESLLSDGYTFSRLDEIDFSNSKTEVKNNDKDGEKETAKPTSESKTTSKPNAEATVSPNATKKPSSTPKATVTEKPAKATVAPTNNSKKDNVKELETE